MYEKAEASLQTAQLPGISGLALPNGWKRADVIVASLLINALALVLPMVVLQVYDRVIPNQGTATFTMLLIMASVVVILDGMLRVLRSILLSWNGAQFEHEASMAAMRKVLAADTLAFEAESSGKHLDRVQAIEQVREFFSGQSMLLVVDLPFALLFLGLIWAIAGYMVWVPLALLAMFLLVSVWAGQALADVLRARSRVDDGRQNFIIEVLGGIHTVKSMAMEKLMMRRYERLLEQSATNVAELGHVNSVIQGLSSGISHLAMVSFVAAGSAGVISGDLTVGALAAGTMLTARVLQPGLRALGLWTQFQSTRLAIEKAAHLFELPDEEHGSYYPDKPLEGRLTMDDVHFQYPEAERELIRGISLDVAPGEAIGITGANGAGKSTLVSVMVGFMPPTKGEIRIDGRPLTDYHADYLRSQVNLMPQRGILFEGTILENMTLFREGEPVDQAIEMARELGLVRILARLPDGLDTRVGGSAVDALSEGVRQKIIMIRGLVGHPRIMVFDDANANLDIANDQRFMGLVRAFRGDRTLIIVSHRPSFLRLADRRFRLHEGLLEPVEDPRVRLQMSESKG